MLNVYAHANGLLVPTGWQEGPTLPPGTVWIDLISPAPQEEKAIEQVLLIDIPVREKLAEIEASSRLYHQGRATFMTATIVTRADNDEPILEAITFIIVDNILVTVRYCEPRAFDVYLQRLQKVTGCPGNGEAVLVGLLEAVVDRLADHLERAGVIVAETSKRIFKDETAKTNRYKEFLRKISEEGDFTSNVRESLVSLSRLVAFLSASFDSGERQVDDRKPMKAHLKTLQRDIASLTDHASYLQDKVTFLLDATLGMINIEQSAIIKIFSVASVVFLPPTLIASIYGMNFKIMPELDWGYGYAFSIFLMVLSVAITFLYFRRKGYL
ncbi:MAG: magnesium transporter CorA family protein [Hyphomicrobiales bacterium]